MNKRYILTVNITSLEQDERGLIVSLPEKELSVTKEILAFEAIELQEMVARIGVK